MLAPDAPMLPEKWRHRSDPFVLVTKVPADLGLMAEFKVRAALIPGTASLAVQEAALEMSSRLRDYVQRYDKRDLAVNLEYRRQALSENSHSSFALPPIVHDYVQDRLNTVLPVVDQLCGLSATRPRSVGILAEHRVRSWHRDPDRAVFVDTVAGRGTQWMQPRIDHWLDGRWKLAKLFGPLAGCEVPENAGIVFNVWQGTKDFNGVKDTDRLLHRSHTDTATPRFAYGTAHTDIRF